jgi:hypothetical protein
MEYNPLQYAQAKNQAVSQGAAAIAGTVEALPEAYKNDKTTSDDKAENESLYKKASADFKSIGVEIRPPKEFEKPAEYKAYVTGRAQEHLFEADGKTLKGDVLKKLGVYSHPSVQEALLKNKIFQQQTGQPGQSDPSVSNVPGAWPASSQDPLSRSAGGGMVASPIPMSNAISSPVSASQPQAGAGGGAPAPQQPGPAPIATQAPQGAPVSAPPVQVASSAQASDAGVAPMASAPSAGTPATPVSSGQAPGPDGAYSGMIKMHDDRIAQYSAQKEEARKMLGFGLSLDGYNKTVNDADKAIDGLLKDRTELAKASMAIQGSADIKTSIQESKAKQKMADDLFDYQMKPGAELLDDKGNVTHPSGPELREHPERYHMKPIAQRPSGAGGLGSNSLAINLGMIKSAAKAVVAGQLSSKEAEERYSKFAGGTGQAILQNEILTLDPNFDFNASISSASAKKNLITNEGKIQDIKVNFANSAKKIFPPKLSTGEYDLSGDNFSPQNATELALACARLASPTGQIAQSTTEEMQQKTGKETLARLFGFLGWNLEGTTQANLRRIELFINREGALAQQQRNIYAKGGMVNFLNNSEGAPTVDRSVVPVGNSGTTISKSGKVYTY